MTLGDVIKKYREEHDLSMDSFSKLSGISKAYISLLEKDRHPKTGKSIAPSIDIIKQAASGMRMDFESLFNMIEDDVDISKPPLPPYSNITPIAKKKFPLYDGIAAGKPRLVPDGVERYVDVTVEIKADFILKVHGDSMIGARIHDGDLVFIRRQPEVENGEIAAVAIGDEATLKRVYYYKDKCLMFLKAENPTFEDMVFQDQELENIKILGKAVAFQSDVK